MEINDKRLKIPLDNFWISEPYLHSRGFIGIGKLSEDVYSCSVFSPGEGIVNRVDTGYLELLFTVEGRELKIELFNLTETLVKENETINRESKVANIVSPHLRVRAYVKEKGNYRQVNPLTVLYAYPKQVHRNHIPRHTPRPVPRAK